MRAKFTIWDIATGKTYWPDYFRKPASNKNVCDLRFTGDSRWLVIVLDDWCVELWMSRKGTWPVLGRWMKANGQLKALRQGLQV